MQYHQLGRGHVLYFVARIIHVVHLDHCIGDTCRSIHIGVFTQSTSRRHEEHQQQKPAHTWSWYSCSDLLEVAGTDNRTIVDTYIYIYTYVDNTFTRNNQDTTI